MYFLIYNSLYSLWIQGTVWRTSLQNFLFEKHINFQLKWPLQVTAAGTWRYPPGRSLATDSSDICPCSFEVRTEDKCASLNSFLKSHQHLPQLHKGREIKKRISVWRWLRSTATIYKNVYNKFPSHTEKRVLCGPYARRSPVTVNVHQNKIKCVLLLPNTVVT